MPDERIRRTSLFFLCPESPDIETGSLVPKTPGKQASGDIPKNNSILSQMPPNHVQTTVTHRVHDFSSHCRRLEATSGPCVGRLRVAEGFGKVGVREERPTGKQADPAIGVHPSAKACSPPKRLRTPWSVGAEVRNGRVGGRGG